MHNYQATVISQYANSPRLLQLIDLFNGYLSLDDWIAAFYQTVWDIDTAKGFGLDFWGKVVGVSRFLKVPLPGSYFGFYGTGYRPFGQAPFYSQPQLSTQILDDDLYRRLIKIKALANISRCTVGQLNSILRQIFPHHHSWVVEDSPMRVSLHFDRRLSLTEYAILTQIDLVPRPAGVQFSIVQPTI